MFTPPHWCRASPDSEPTKLIVHSMVDGSRQSANVSVGTIAAKAVYTIGRSAPDNGVDVVLRGELTSRMHAAICLDGDGGKFLVDLRSTHGTFLGSKRLEPHQPAKMTAGVLATFGSGPNAEALELAEGDEDVAVIGARPIDADRTAKKARIDDDSLAALYGDLPEATVTQCAPRAPEKIAKEEIPPPPDPTKVIFLDIDGVVRSVHGRTDFAKNVRTMQVDGKVVAMMGDGSSENLAGIDFWPHAMRNLRHIVQKTQSAIVLSSQWRIQPELVEGINNQLTEYSMAMVHSSTPDLDNTGNSGSKAIHKNVRERRCKEIRKWLRQNPKIERFVAIDDMDLSASKKEEALHERSGSSEPLPFFDLQVDFVKCNPAVGLNIDLAKLAVCFLNDVPVTLEDFQAAYGGGETADPPPPVAYGAGPAALG